MSLPVHLKPPAETGRLESLIALVVSGPGSRLIPVSLVELPRAGATTIAIREDQIIFGLAWPGDRRTTIVEMLRAITQDDAGRVAAQSPRLVRV